MRRFVCFACFCFEFLAVTAFFYWPALLFVAILFGFRTGPLSAVVIVSMELKVTVLRGGDDILMGRLSL
jgi:hypothetical protein